MACAYTTLVGLGLGGTSIVARAVTRQSDMGGVAIDNATIGDATSGLARVVQCTRL